MDYELTEEVLEMFALLTHAFGLAAGRRSSYQKNLERITQDLISTNQWC